MPGSTGAPGARLRYELRCACACSENLLALHMLSICPSCSHGIFYQYFISAESVRSQLKRLRIHPSNLVFLYSSDELPPADVESK
jgi:hypothetical protein